MSPVFVLRRPARFRPLSALGAAIRFTVFAVLVWMLSLLAGCDSAEVAPPVSDVSQFTNIAREALGDGAMIWNDRPGVAVFDYDRDGDMDIFITANSGHPNFLHRNDGDGVFVDVAAAAGAASPVTNASGVVACDFDNDGYQDIYTAALGVAGDDLDFRSALGDSEGALALRAAVSDRLFLNDGDGSFSDITEAAFGDAVNIRSAASVVCADVDSDGWLDLYVANLGDPDFRTFTSASHPGHYNMLYRNRGDLTFEEVSVSAGVRGGQIVMRDHAGNPILFTDDDTGQQYEGYDPNAADRAGNRVGEPTGQTHSALFFDYDDDRDPDLWVGDDGNRLRVYRNDSTPGDIRFTSVAREMGIDSVGSWMGFGVGDYDGDADLDVFITNMGYHLFMRPPKSEPSGTCEYHVQFEWANCLPALLRNEGDATFMNVAAIIPVTPSPIMPPDSLDASKVHPAYSAPTGLAAYDFGFGATFFDYDNDGDRDLYWLGSLGRSEGPGGNTFPAAGRMLRGDGGGGFEDITTRARLLDILGVDYSERDPVDPMNSLAARKMDARFHENGKGVAHGDLDGDGCVDLIGTNSSGPVWMGSVESLSPMQGPVFVWMNGCGGDDGWIVVRLRGRMSIDGVGSNADGIGARVYLKYTPPGRSEPLTQVQEARAGSSYLSMDSVDLEFGIGGARTVDEIEVLWPSGARQTLVDLSSRQTVEIVEPELGR